MRDRGPLYASMVTYVVPCVALMLGWLDGESVTTTHLVALAGILLMVWLVQGDPIMPRPAVDAPAIEREDGSHGR